MNTKSNLNAAQLVRVILHVAVDLFDLGESVGARVPLLSNLVLVLLRLALNLLQGLLQQLEHSLVAFLHDSVSVFDVLLRLSFQGLRVADEAVTNVDLQIRLKELVA